MVLQYTYILNLFLHFFLKKLFYCCSITVVSISPHQSPPPKPNPPPSGASTLPLGFVHVSFILVPEKLFPTIPSHLPSGYCQIVLNFNVFGYILFAFFLLLIMFQLKVRLYGICPSPHGLFHLA